MISHYDGFLQQLRDMLEDAFSWEELRSICFEMDIKSDNVAGDIKRSWIENLLLMLVRQGRLGELVTKAQRQRKARTWPTIPAELSLPHLKNPPPARITTYPPKVHRFTGRETEVRRIYNLVQTGNSDPNVFTLSISGIGGIGKSTLAAHVLYELEKDRLINIQDQVLWTSLHAGDATAILEAWGSRFRGNDKNASVQDILNQQRFGSKFLLAVVDDVLTAETDDIDQIKASLPPYSILVLLINDPESWESDVDEAISLDFPTIDEAVSIFRAYQKDTEIISKLEVSRIVENLDRLPLAIKQAVSWLEFNEYESEALHTLDIETIDSHGGNLQTTFDAHYQSLRPNARQVLNWMSVFAQGPIRKFSVKTVLNDSDLSEKQINDALETLANRTLIIKLEESDPQSAPFEERYEVPQLLQQFTTKRLLDSGDEDRAQLAHLEYYRSQALTFAEVSREAHNNLDAIFPNIKIAIQNAIRFRKHKHITEFATALCTNSAFLNFRSYLEDARLILGAAVVASERLHDLRKQGVYTGSIGIALDLDGQVSEAVKYYSEALAISKEPDVNNKSDQARWHHHLGMVFLNNDIELATQHLQESLNCYRESGDTWRIGYSIGYLGQVYRAKGDENRAILEYQKALKEARTLEDKNQEGTFLYFIGVSYRYLGNPAKAIEFFRQSIKAFETSGNDRVKNEALSDLGLCHYTLGEMAEAERHFTQVLENLRRNGQEPMRVSDNVDQERTALRARATANIALSHRYVGKLQKAETKFKEALEDYRFLKDRRNEADVLANLGITYRYMGQNHLAIRMHEEAYEIRRAIQDRRGEGASLGNKANSLINLGKSRDAIPLLERALRISREVGDKRSEGNALDNLGRAYYHLGYVMTAVEYYGKALDISNEMNQKRSSANRLGRIGNAYRKLGRLEEAKEYLRKALAAAQAIGDRRSQSNHFGYLGVVYLRLGQDLEARAHTICALKLCRQVADRRKEAIWLGNLGMIHQEAGRLALAKRYYSRALSGSKNIDDQHNTGIVIMRLGYLRFREFNYKEALKKYREAANIFGEQNSGDKHQLASTMQHIGDLYKNRGNLQRAKQQYLRTLVIFKELQNQAAQINVLRRLGYIYIELGNPQESLTNLEEARKVCKSIRSIQLAEITGLLAVANSLNMSYELALELAGESLDLSMASGDKKLVARSLGFLGEIHMRNDHFEEAADCFTRSLDMHQQNKWDARWYMTKLGLCKEQISKAQPSLDISAAQEAMQLLQHAQGLCSQLGDRLYEKLCIDGLSRLYYETAVYFTQLGKTINLNHDEFEDNDDNR